MWVYSCIIQNEIERSAATLTRDTTSDLPIFFCLGEEFFLCSSSTRVNPTTRQSDDFLLYFFFFFRFLYFSYTFKADAADNKYARAVTHRFGPIPLSIRFTA